MQLARRLPVMQLGRRLSQLEETQIREPRSSYKTFRPDFWSALGSILLARPFAALLSYLKLRLEVFRDQP